MKKICLYLMALGAVFSCTKNEDGSHSEGPVEVALTASISNAVEVSTKAPFELVTPTAETSLTAAIWASSISKSYRGSQKTEPGETAKYIDFHDSTRFTSADRQLLDHKLFYPTTDTTGKIDKPNVYFVGLCPKRGWSVWKCSTHKTPADTLAWDIAEYTFDGCSDVMYAPEDTNSLKTSTLCPEMKFKHILTWLKLNVVADEDAIKAWGNVQYIKIVSHNILRIDLYDGAVTYQASTASTEMDTYCFTKGKSTDNVFNSVDYSSASVELTTSPQEVAYVLCASRDAKAGTGNNEYEAVIKTEYRPETHVAINLKDAGGNDYTGDTSGKQFTVTFRFKLGDNVVTVARVTPWENGGIGVKEITE